MGRPSRWRFGMSRTRSRLVVILAGASALIAAFTTSANATASGKGEIILRSNNTCIANATPGAVATLATCSGTNKIENSWEVNWTGSYYGNHNAIVYFMNDSNSNPSNWV